GIACARALRRVGLPDIRLKWPNDLRIGRAKIGGILIEQRGEAGGVCRLVIGVGLNVAMRPDQGAAIDQAWTTVEDEVSRRGGARVSRNELMA
ncbi:hypothetical protein ABTM47_19545, partial [Acinetobacter baumannii]